MTAGFQFSPSQLSIHVGDSVLVRNVDSAHHTFTDSGYFDSGDVGPGASYRYRFGAPGTFDFVCAYHSTLGMKGSITVR